MKRFKYLTLAALVAFAACDEGEDAPPQGTISGAVTIEGTGASGVTVSLSSGATTTTDGSGQYTFADVDAGSYTVTISGYPADATFTTTSQAAAITSAGQVVTVNFAGTYVRTSAILGTVAAGGPLEGVTVSIGGGQSTQTDANGQYSFSGLRAGTYTVTISGYDTNQYVFAETSKSVTVATGESEVVSFSGMLATTAVISGHMFVDENVKNDTFDSTEEALAVAGVTISLQLGLGDPITVETAADGSFEFTDLAAGDYQVTIDDGDADIPDNYAFGGSVSAVRTVTAGMTATVNWPFDIVAQTMRVGAFLGRDGGTAMVAPVEGVDIELYPSEVDLNASTNILGTETTGADGYAEFLFDRADDTAPGGGTDHIVYARWVNTTPTGIGTLYTQNGETQMEISYAATSAVATGPDVFDFLYGALTVGFEGDEIDGDSLSQWRFTYRQNDTTVAAGDLFNLAGVGYASFDIANASIVDTVYLRLASVQPLGQDGGHAWEQTLTADRGEISGGYLRFVWDGTVLPSDTVRIGLSEVKYLDSDVRVRDHHEADDTLGLTQGDNFQGSPSVGVAIVDANGDTIAAGATQFFPNTDGIVTFANVATETDYTFLAQSGAEQVFLTGNSLAFNLDGSDQTADFFNDESTFVHKFNNTQIEGWARGADGVDWTVGADSIAVHIVAAPENLGSTTDTTVYTDGGANGAYATAANLLEGPYIVTVTDREGEWAFFDTLTAAPPLSSGEADNDDERTAVRDLETNGFISTARFWARYMDTSVEGRVINDRDDDDNTIDPNEALAGAQIELVDAGGTLLETATTDANGEYSFGGLREGTYLVRWVDDTPDNTVVVLKALNTDSAFVTTTAAAPVAGGSIAALPRWDYEISAGDGDDDVADFMFLYKNTTINATVQTGAAVKIAGMTVSLRRCNVSTGAVSPPQTAVDQTCTTYLGSTVTAVSDANGVATFSDLIEGVYQIAPQPGTVGTYTTSAPASTLYITIGSADVESATFIIS